MGKCNNTSNKKPADIFHRPCQFCKIRDIFAPTLVSFTLWLAIAALAATIVFSLKPHNLEWAFGVLGMNITEATTVVAQSIIIIVFIGILGIAGLAIVIMSVTFVGVNCIRGVLAMVDWIKNRRHRSTRGIEETLDSIEQRVKTSEQKGVDDAGKK